MIEGLNKEDIKFDELLETYDNLIVAGTEDSTEMTENAKKKLLANLSLPMLIKLNNFRTNDKLIVEELDKRSKEFPRDR